MRLFANAMQCARRVGAGTHIYRVDIYLCCVVCVLRVVCSLAAYSGSSSSRHTYLFSHYTLRHRFSCRRRRRRSLSARRRRSVCAPLRMHYNVYSARARMFMQLIRVRARADRARSGCMHEMHECMPHMRPERQNCSSTHSFRTYIQFWKASWWRILKD